MKSKLVMIAMTILGIASPGQAQELKSGIDKANMDLSVKPGDDFYEYSAGSWLKNHPLDAVHPMNGAFTDLDEQNNDRIKELVAEYAAKKNAARHGRTETRRTLSHVHGQCEAQQAGIYAHKTCAGKNKQGKESQRVH